MPAEEPSDFALLALLSGELDDEARLELERRLESDLPLQERLRNLSGEDYFLSDLHSIQAPPDQSPEIDHLIKKIQSGEKQAASTPEAIAKTGYERLLTHSDDPDLLGTLGPYDIERVVATGGMGVVFKGRHSEGGPPLAIKMLSPAFAGDPVSRSRFLREAAATAVIDHPNVIPIHAVETECNFPHLVMRFVQGPSLQERLGEDAKPLPPEELIALAHALASALAAAHEANLIHRDIKPSNILIDTTETVPRIFLSDFGLAVSANDATLTKTGTVIGTPQFMSPEQVAGDDIDASSDIFSLGSVLYTAATGSAPFEGEAFPVLAAAIKEDAPPPPLERNPEIEPWLSNLIVHLMAKNPADRPESAAVVARLIEERADLGTLQMGRRLGRKNRLKLRARLFATRILPALLVLGSFVALERSGTTSIVNTALASLNGDGLYLRGRWGTFDTLENAIKKASSGDTIVLRTNEVQRSGPITIPKGKNLTICADAGFDPKIEFATPPDEPAIKSKSALHLEGLRILHLRSAQRMHRLIQLDAAPGSVLRCDVRRELRIDDRERQYDDGALFYLFNCPRFEIKDSRIFALTSPSVDMKHFNGATPATLRLENNWIRADRHKVHAARDSKVTVEAKNNFIQGDYFLELAGDGSRLHFKFNLTGNLFYFPRGFINHPGGNEIRTRKFYHWNASSNVYILNGPLVDAPVDGPFSLRFLEDLRTFFEDPAIETDSTLVRRWNKPFPGFSDFVTPQHVIDVISGFEHVDALPEAGPDLSRLPESL